ncbi:MAG: 3-hydroxyacyl-CoA dehydrogenase family protein, partial [Candidatus Kapaibacterium sp.]
MTIGICGAGTMGRGIAISSLTAGHVVVMVDLSESALEAAQTSVREQLQKAVEKGKMTEEQFAAASTSISISTDLGVLHSAEIVIEAIAEKIEIKHMLFSSLEKIVTPEAILATNTSSISIAALARVLENPSRFVGLHFFNPAHIMKLVEIIKGPRTSSATVETCLAFAKGLGKTPVVAADAPGFIVNRIARNYYNESQRIVMEGASTIPQVDALMKGLGFK